VIGRDNWRIDAIELKYGRHASILFRPGYFGAPQDIMPPSPMVAQRYRRV